MKKKDELIKGETFEEFEEYFLDIISFSKEDKEVNIIKKLKQRDNNGDFQNAKVWALFGRKNSNSRWICLQVASTMNNIMDEIIPDVRCMFKDNYDIKDDEDCRYFSTEFYKDVYKIPKNMKNVSAYRYRKMYNEYQEFTFKSINMFEYLNIDIDEKDALPNIFKDLVDIAMPEYVEALFAYKTQAIYWNVYNNGVDKKALDLFQKNNYK